MKKTLIRIITGIFLISLLVLCLHLGDIVFLLIFGAFFLITVREMDHLLKAMGKEIVITPASIFAGFFGIVYYLTSYNLSVVFAFGLLMVVATVVGQVLLMRDDFSAAAYCLLPFVYPILSECALVAIYFALPPWMAKTACCAAILCPSMGDSCAYCGGMALGKTPLAPQISPKKTVEGAVFSLIGSTLMGVGLYYAQNIWEPGQGMSLFALVSLGFICGVAGQFGDLFASCLKRSADVKDFSETLPGHGGVLDRLDSVLLCAPVVLAFCILALLS